MLEPILKLISGNPQLVLLIIVVAILYILNAQYNYVSTVCSKLGSTSAAAPVVSTTTAAAL